MRARLSWTRLARADLLEIHAWIGTRQPVAADQFLDRMESLAALLSEQPRMGVRRPDIAPGLRMLVAQPYLLLYRLEPDSTEGAVAAVQIVRVLDGRRDLPRLF